MNDLTLAGSLATAPSAAFAELRERPRFWFPLIVIVVAHAILTYWYYTVVDLEWFKDSVYAASPDFQKLSEAERAQALTMIGRTTLQWFSLLGVVFMFPIFFLLHAAYLLIAAKVTKVPLGFKHWFSITCWTSLPLLLSVIVAAILLGIAETNQIAPGTMQPLGLNELALHRPFGSPGQSLFDALTIPGVWSWILMIIGMRVFSQRSWTYSAVVALIPVVLLYGIWAFFAFR